VSASVSASVSLLDAAMESELESESGSSSRSAWVWVLAKGKAWRQLPKALEYQVEEFPAPPPVACCSAVEAGWSRVRPSRLRKPAANRPLPRPRGQGS
jgi:hypothetical protein